MKKNDVILIALLLTICAVSLFAIKLWQRQSTTDRAYVRVEVDGEVYGTYPLNEEHIERIQLDNGCYNVLIIKDGKADISEASCPDQICVRHMPIHYADESIVCLPNKLTVTVVGGQESEIDATTN